MSDDRAEFKPPPPPVWLRPIDRLMSWHIERRWAVEEARINGDHRLARRTVLLTGAKFLLVIGLLLALDWTDEGTIGRSMAMWGTGAVLGFWVMGTMLRQQAFGRGWRKGRRTAFEALREAQRRGHSIEDWYLAELERDLNTPI